MEYIIHNKLSINYFIQAKKLLISSFLVMNSKVSTNCVYVYVKCLQLQKTDRLFLTIHMHGVVNFL